jgi:hypothetical protein
MLYGESQPVFRRNISPPSSVSKCKPSKKPARNRQQAYQLCSLPPTGHYLSIWQSLNRKKNCYLIEFWSMTSHARKPAASPCTWLMVASDIIGTGPSVRPLVMVSYLETCLLTQQLGNMICTRSNRSVSVSPMMFKVYLHHVLKTLTLDIYTSGKLHAPSLYP